MYRYFLVHDDHLPEREHLMGKFGHAHWIHLSSHGEAGKGWNVLVMHDQHPRPHEGWIAFPKVVDAKTPISRKLDHRLLADVGLTGDETTLEAAEKLGAIFSPFEHP